MKQIIWIDVGTHFAQEHNSLFGPDYNFYLFVLRRFIGGKLFNRGRFVSFEELKNIFFYRKKIRKKKQNFFTIFVEANPKIAYQKRLYPIADILFNIALTDDKSSSVSVAKLFLGNGDELSEGNSIFAEKHQSLTSEHLPTLGVSTMSFFEALNEYIEEKFPNFIILLRLNCEGVEDDVIYSAYKNFGSKLKLICGSLKDVEELKGIESLKKLTTFMHEHNLPFVKFSSGIYSWPEAHKAIFSLLDDESSKY